MEGYELVVAPPVARAIQRGLPENIAAAVVEFLTGPLIANPRRAGNELRRELTGVYSARRGTYRILYRIDDDAREVLVLRVEGDERAEWWPRCVAAFPPYAEYAEKTDRLIPVLLAERR